MGCLTLNVNPVEGAALAVAQPEPAALVVTQQEGASLKVALVDGAALAVTPNSAASLAVELAQGASFSIGEVCSVSGGTIVVLAASDGPLRTRDGGYLLLDPAQNPPEN